MSMNVLVLESVGSCIDEDGTVYPMNVDNRYGVEGTMDDLAVLIVDIDSFGVEEDVDAIL